MSDLNFSIYMHLPETRLCPENKHFPNFYAAIFSVICHLKKYDTFSEYFALVSQKNKLTNTYYADYFKAEKWARITAAI